MCIIVYIIVSHAIQKKLFWKAAHFLVLKTESDFTKICGEGKEKLSFSIRKYTANMYPYLPRFISAHQEFRSNKVFQFRFDVKFLDYTTLTKYFEFFGKISDMQMISNRKFIVHYKDFNDKVST